MVVFVVCYKSDKIGGGRKESKKNKPLNIKGLFL